MWRARVFSAFSFRSPGHSERTLTQGVRSRPGAERLFVAVALPDATRTSLARSLPERLPGRRVQPEKWHFTLQFLGDVAPVTRDQLITELRNEALGDSFVARLAGLGGFPRPEQARVLWIGVDRGAPNLTELAAVVARACSRIRLQVDERPYSPHLTLSRLDPPHDLRPLIAVTEFPPLEIDVSEVLLIRSVLGQGPPRYVPLARFPLRAAR
jgi:RNA 2',3'-cyclic 3'-phosphodiesterase